MKKQPVCTPCRKMRSLHWSWSRSSRGSNGKGMLFSQQHEVSSESSWGGFLILFFTNVIVRLTFFSAPVWLIQLCYISFPGIQRWYTQDSCYFLLYSKELKTKTKTTILMYFFVNLQGKYFIFCIHWDQSKELLLTHLF